MLLLHSHTCLLSRLSRVWLFATPWTIARQASLSMEYSRQEYWSGLPCPPPSFWPRIEAVSPHWQADSFPLSNWGSPTVAFTYFQNISIPPNKTPCPLSNVCPFPTESFFLFFYFFGQEELKKKVSVFQRHFRFQTKLKGRNRNFPYTPSSCMHCLSYHYPSSE